MKNFKRTAVLVLAVIFILNFAHSCGFRKFGIRTELPAEAITITRQNIITAYNLTARQKEFQRLVVSAVEKHSAAIDITKFYFTYKWDSQKVIAEFFLALECNPQLFYIANSVSVYEGNTTAHLGDLVYSATAAEVSKQKTELGAAIDDALTYLANSGCRSDVDKVLAVHDYLVDNITYAYKESKDMENAPIEGSSLYGALVKKYAVCQGYAEAYKVLMNYLGVPCETVASEKMNHVWDYVRIGGDWFHVDPTYDDPTVRGENPQVVLHSYFLKSDKGLKDHSGWSTNLPAAVNTAFDSGMYWDTFDSYKNDSLRFVELSGSLYYTKVDPDSPAKNQQKYVNDPNFLNIRSDLYTDIYKFDMRTGVTRKIFTVKGTWYIPDEKTGGYKKDSWYSNTYVGLAVYNGRIFFNTPTAVYSIDENGKGLRKLLSVNKDSGGVIYRITSVGDKLNYTRRLSADGKPTDVSVKLAALIGQNITLSSRSVTIDAGGTKTLTADAGKGYVNWLSTNTAAVSVTKNGSGVTLRGNRKGSAIIYAFLSDGKYAACSVTVK